jgi:hypothetical protein
MGPSRSENAQRTKYTSNKNTLANKNRIPIKHITPTHRLSDQPHKASTQSTKVPKDQGPQKGMQNSLCDSKGKTHRLERIPFHSIFPKFSRLISSKNFLAPFTEMILPLNQLALVLWLLMQIPSLEEGVRDRPCIFWPRCIVPWFLLLTLVVYPFVRYTVRNPRRAGLPFESISLSYSVMGSFSWHKSFRQTMNSTRGK